MKQKVLLLAVLTGLLSGQAIAQNCQRLVELQNSAVEQANNMFNGPDNRFSIVVCNNTSEAIYGQFYAQMQFQRTRSFGVPTAGLSPVNAAIQPGNRARTTGMISAEDENNDVFNIKLRTRFTSGEAVDYSSEQKLPPGKSAVFQDQGFTVGVVRLGKGTRR